MNNYEFYVHNISVVNGVEDIDINFVPTILRRRLTTLNKAAFTTLDKCYDNSIENIIYASGFGELDRLIKIIQQYTQDNEVSPSNFSSSVHNGVLGLYSVLKKYKKPYNALSACKNTLSTGLLSAISSKKNVLFCYADMVEETPFSVTLNLSFEHKQNSQKWLIKGSDNKNINSEIDIILPFLNNAVDKVEFYNYTLERV